MKRINNRDLHSKLHENNDIQENIQVLNYLFENCIPEFPNGNMSEWLQGRGTSSKNIEKNISLIQHHPLMPSNIKVSKLMVDRQKLLEIGAS